MTTRKDKTIKLLGQERRRRWSVEETLAMVRESLEPGHSVSVVATSLQLTVPLAQALSGRRSVPMKRFTEEQIIGFLHEADAGLPIKEPCRRQGFGGQLLPLAPQVRGWGACPMPIA